LLVAIEKGAVSETDAIQLETLIERAFKEFDVIGEHIHRHIANMT